MIRYALTCDNDHNFESWFQSAGAFDKLTASGLLTCAVCGVSEVRKSVMAPRIGKGEAGASDDTPEVTEPSLCAPATAAEQAVRDLRSKIEASSEDVGVSFADEARKIHDGDAPQRSIYGEAKLQDAVALLNEGIPILPLPFMPTRKSN